MSCLPATLSKLYFCFYVFVFVYLQVRHSKTLFLRSLYHHLSENIWFVWSKTSYSGDRRRCHQAGRTNKRTNEQTNKQQWKIELLSLWAVGRLSFAILCCSSLGKRLSFGPKATPAPHYLKVKTLLHNRNLKCNVLDYQNSI